LTILQDASTPAPVDNTVSTAGTAVTASFSPPANSMVVIVVNIGYLANTTTGPTVTCADSLANSYTAGPAAYDGQFAGSYQFSHFYSSAPGAITVTVTRTVALGQSNFEVVPYVLTGANSSQAGQGTANGTGTTGAFTKSVTTTATGSWTCVGLAVGNVMTGTPTGVGVTTDHSFNDGTDLVSGAAGHAITGSPGATTLGWTWTSNSDFAWTALEILPAAGGASAISLGDVAGANDTLSVAVAVQLADTAGSVDTITAGSPALSPSLPEWAAATDDISVAQSQVSQIADKAAAVDSIQVQIGGAPAPTPGTVIKYASPAFIRSQMPRMHVQNLLTGQWLNRDVQGIVSPSVTWALNTADSFTCTLAPPRGELLDASGNALVMEWRDAIYLEQDDQIKFGGIVTQSSLAGPQWNITAMGFAGYPNGMPYEGANYSATKIDALDVVRFLWNWLQGQPGGNLNMELGTVKSGVLLGAQTDTGVYSEVAKRAATGDTSIWIGNAQAFNDRESITISGIPYTIAHVYRNVSNVATGQMSLTSKLTEPHAIHDPVAQVTPVNTVLARAAASGASNIQLGTSAPFASGENITVGTDLYTINQVVTDSKGFVTGNVTLTGNLRKAYAAGTRVTQVRTITPFQLFWYNSTDIGSEITSIQQEAIFDFREWHFWGDQATRNTVRHQLLFGVPRLGNRLTGLRFAEGENIIVAVQVTRDGTRYASNVVGLGAGSGAAQIRVTAASANTGRLRRTFVFTDQTANTVARMSSKATKVLTSMQNIDSVTQIIVKNHPNAPFGSFSPGDDIPVMLASGWRNTTIWSRIISMTQDPTTDQMSLTLARSDSFTYIAQSGQAGTL